MSRKLKGGAAKKKFYRPVKGVEVTKGSLAAAIEFPASEVRRDQTTAAGGALDVGKIAVPSQYFSIQAIASNNSPRSAGLVT
jgi:hypothetical protein